MDSKILRREERLKKIFRIAKTVPMHQISIQYYFLYKQEIISRLIIVSFQDLQGPIETGSNRSRLSKSVRSLSSENRTVSKSSLMLVIAYDVCMMYSSIHLRLLKSFFAIDESFTSR